jgi:hypothetical protein
VASKQEGKPPGEFVIDASRRLAAAQDLAPTFEATGIYTAAASNLAMLARLQ